MLKLVKWEFQRRKKKIIRLRTIINNQLDEIVVDGEADVMK